jgi:hypothetical protein
MSPKQLVFFLRSVASKLMRQDCALYSIKNRGDGWITYECIKRKGSLGNTAKASSKPTKRGIASVRKDTTQASEPCVGLFTLSCPATLSHLKGAPWKLIDVKCDHLDQCCLMKPLILCANQNYLKGRLCFCRISILTIYPS